MVKRLGRWVAVACLVTAVPSSANVKLTRRGDGSALIFNDIGSGWRIGGRAPTDAYLMSRCDARTPYDDLIRQHATREGVDPRLVRSVILVESNFNPRAVSPKGARGLMQLMPGTARRFGVGNSFDAVENIRGGVRYLAELLALFRGDTALALAGYNAGEGAVARHGGVPPYPETQEYVRRALLAYRGSNASPALSGGFRGLAATPEVSLLAAAKDPGAVSRPAPQKTVLAVSRPAVPVRIHASRGGLVLSNTAGGPKPVQPLLGRVDPAR